MRQRLYFDTSVFGGHFDEEFAEFTIPLFERLDRGEFILLFSSVTQNELEEAPDNVRNLVTNIKKNTEFIEVSDDTVNLATEYIEEKSCGENKLCGLLTYCLGNYSKSRLFNQLEF